MKSMFRTQDVLLIALMVATAGGTYKIKHEAQVSLAKIAKLQRDIRFEACAFRQTGESIDRPRSCGQCDK